MAALALLLVAAAASATSSAPAVQPQHTIVVTGVPIRDTERALRDCLARHCPPKEDINASLAHAENLFVAGRYDDARQVTKAAISRNRKFARDFPVDVSDLYRANSRIAAHLGEGWDYQFSTTEMHRTLDRSFGKTDPRVLGADLEWGDMYASMSRFELARSVYKDTERQALAAGRPDIASMARVRAAWLYQLKGDGWLARQELQKLAGDRSPDARLARLSALVLLARLDRKEGKTQSSDALLRELGSISTDKPVLLFAPSIDLGNRLPEDQDSMWSGSTLNLLATDNYSDRWIDVGFWVTPAGRVSEAEIIRSEGPTDWTKSLMRSISGRIYAPMKSATYRIERYSYTSRWMNNITGTHIRRRSPNARIEYVDLTKDDGPVAAR